MRYQGCKSKVGFGFSFSGIFFGGYAKDATKRNYAMQAKSRYWSI